VRDYVRRASFSLASENALRRRNAAIDPVFFRPRVSAFPPGRKNTGSVA
jgi:hypothetical protein